MLKVDLHTHTLFSHCGLHTHIEVLERARELGMTAIAITDHGPALHPRFSEPFYDRLHQPVSGIQLLKGMECNLVGESGEIDLPKKYLPYLDVVLLGIHFNTEKGLGKDRYTEMMLQAIEKNPMVDIITHPNDLTYPVDFEAVASAAAAHGMAVELNNSKTLLKRVPDEMTRALVLALKNSGCRMIVTSDMHALDELGRDDSVMPFVEETDFPRDHVVSDTVDQVFNFVNERRHLKKYFDSQE